MSEVELAEADGRVTATLTDDGIEARMRAAVTQSVQVLDRRLNALGTTEPSIQAEGSERILVQVPGLEDTAQLKQILGQTARMTFHMECTRAVDRRHRRRRPAASWIESARGDEAPMMVESRALLTGDDLADAQPSFHQQTGEPIVTFRFNTRGAPDLRRGDAGRMSAGASPSCSTTNTSPRRSSATPILGGSGLIEGNFTVESAQNLVRAAARRRAARRPDHRRGAHGRPEPRAGFDPRRRHRLGRGARRRRRLHDRLLRHPRLLRRHRHDREHLPDVRHHHARPAPR